MPTSTPRGPRNSHEGPLGPQSFAASASTRALGLVAIAILVGFLLIVIVDSNGTTSTKTQASSEPTASSATDTTAENTAASTTSTTKPVANTAKPADVSVLVLNGSSIAGVAGTVTTEIKNLSYKTLVAGNDTSKDKGTIIYYKSGFENDAKQLATNVVPGLLTKLKISQTVKTLQFPASAPTAWDQKDLVTANVVVVVGNP
ncbi:MAG TPA: LytR C-terminal domain-containing protein [Acidimicrobiia bacterium]|nr:LytR C-terminal domain-containing protein [Acidimicrobiia bacterium]